MAAAPLANASWDRLRRRWTGSPAPAALAAWRDGLLDLLPPRLREVWLPPTRRLWLRVDGGRLGLVEEAGPRRQDLGELPLDAEAVHDLAACLDRRDVDGEMWLLLPASRGLTRTLLLPQAAESQLEAVLRHEIDRQTPFGPEQVVHAGQVLGRDAASGQIRVELSVLPKDSLEAALAALGPLAARLSGIDLDDAAHRGGRRRNLLPPARRRQHADRDARLRLALVAGIVLALAGTGLLALHNRAEALASLEAQRDAAYDAARRARELRSQLEAAAGAANFLAEQRRGRATALEVLDDVTRRLGDDVYLTRFALEGDRVTLTGVAVSAGTVVAPLQQSPFLRGPALAGMVQKDPNTGRDSFTVIAQAVAPSAEGASAEAASAEATP